MKPEMSRCATCKHTEKVHAFTACTHEALTSEDPSPTGAFTSSFFAADSYDVIGYFVGPDFGCVHHSDYDEQPDPQQQSFHLKGPAVKDGTCPSGEATGWEDGCVVKMGLPVDRGTTFVIDPNPEQTR